MKDQSCTFRLILCKPQLLATASSFETCRPLARLQQVDSAYCQPPMADSRLAVMRPRPFSCIAESQIEQLKTEICVVR